MDERTRILAGLKSTRGWQTLTDMMQQTLEGIRHDLESRKLDSLDEARYLQGRAKEIRSILGIVDQAYEELLAEQDRA